MKSMVCVGEYEIAHTLILIRLEIDTNLSSPPPPVPVKPQDIAPTVDSDLIIGQPSKSSDELDDISDLLSTLIDVVCLGEGT
jgi:hypothetical protein